MSSTEYDEPGSRTRQAWLRSALGMVAVTVLVERGLAIGGMPALLGLGALAPAVAFVAMSVGRSAELGPGHSADAGRSTVVVTAVAVIALAVVGAASVVVP